MAQSVKRLTLDFGSGHDLMVCEIERHVGLCADSSEPAWHSLSLPLLCPSLRLSLFLKNKYALKKLNKNSKIGSTLPSVNCQDSGCSWEAWS